jgi:hypothetical protein
VDPQFNNRWPASLRFLYTGAGLSVALSEFARASGVADKLAAVSAFASFEASLRRDLRRTGHLYLVHDRETHVGGEAGALFWFGAKSDQQRRRGRLSLFGSTEWLNESGLDPRGGVRLAESLAWTDDTRRFAWWPERGHRLRATLTSRQTVRTDGRPADSRYDLVAGVGWMQLWRLAHDHVLASNLGANLVIPLASEPEFRSLMRVGGLGGLSGYLADEAFGLAVASLQFEYRHVYTNNLGLNLLHVAWLRSLGGVLFTGAATASNCSDYGG